MDSRRCVSNGFSADISAGLRRLLREAKVRPIAPSTFASRIDGLNPPASRLGTFEAIIKGLLPCPIREHWLRCLCPISELLIIAAAGGIIFKQILSIGRSTGRRLPPVEELSWIIAEYAVIGRIYQRGRLQCRVRLAGLVRLHVDEVAADPQGVRIIVIRVWAMRRLRAIASG